MDNIINIGDILIAQDKSDSTISTQKFFNMIVKIYLNGEFIEVPLSSQV